MSKLPLREVFEQAKLVLGSVTGRHHELVRTIISAICNFRCKEEDTITSEKEAGDYPQE